MTTNTQISRSGQNRATTMAYTENTMTLALSVGHMLGEWIARLHSARISMPQTSTEATS